MSQSEFGTMILSHQSFLQQLALKLTRDSEESDDLMQETFFKALKNQDKFQQGTNIKGWLYTIMKNTFINAYRKKKNQNTFVDETDNKYFINLGETEKTVQTDAAVDREYMMNQINEVEKTYVDILSEQAGKVGKIVNRKLVNVVVSGDLSDHEKDVLIKWIFAPVTAPKPDFI